MRKNILVVAAHPDDEILGCSATAARFIKEGHVAYTLILGEGITARDKIRSRGKRESDLLELKRQANRANQIVGIKKVFFCDFPDNRFDSRPLLDIIKAIERIKKEVAPDIIFTHFSEDLNIDHRVTYNAVLTAFRPTKGEKTREIYSFEIPSSTEWQYPVGFSPNVYFDISSTINLKVKALSQYKAELREFPHPRSLEGVELNAKYRGMNIGVSYAEAFKCVRLIR